MDYRLEVVEFRNENEPGRIVDSEMYADEPTLRYHANEIAHAKRRFPAKVFMYDLTFGRKYLGVVKADA